MDSLSKLFSSNILYKSKSKYQYTKLSKKQINEIHEICKRWLIPKSTEKNDKILIENLDKLYSCYKKIDYSAPIKAFTDRLDKIPYKFDKSGETSSAICFYGGIITSLLNYGYIKEIEGLFTFALSYLLIDCFLDDDSITDSEKIQSMMDVYNFINGDSKNIRGNKIIESASDRYQELIKRVPNCQVSLKKLFESELKGVVIQKKNNLDRQIYRNIAKEKGGMTSLCIASIIGLDLNNKDHFNLGSLIQQVDDIIDYKDDTKLGIFTWARYDIENGNLDEYVYETIVSINQLGNIYNFFKVILLMGIVLAIHDNPKFVSNELLTIIYKYDIYDKTSSKDTLQEWFQKTLYNYVFENKIRNNSNCP